MFGGYGVSQPINVDILYDCIMDNITYRGEVFGALDEYTEYFMNGSIVYLNVSIQEKMQIYSKFDPIFNSNGTQYCPLRNYKLVKVVHTNNSEEVPLE